MRLGSAKVGRPLRRAEWAAQATYTTLRLHNVTADMRGLYTCLGSNQEGDGQSNALNLNVQFAPVCQEDQREEYVAPRGGSVTIACTVVAYPASVTFSWAIKRTPESQPVRLHSVGRKEGLTGHYTLTRVEEESVEVWCWAQNTVGAQTAPCKFTVYTQGRPGPVHSCRVTNHTAHGFMVNCVSGPLRSVNTQYTLLVYAQILIFVVS
ncbi:muscle M-line assembly protein unc-89-like [Procambarus clarkii]|uniref:muscle M-line assembly protein unc-89-like n=1 Tax=Procambarus clarkii TaxID=6728 RepID=UPI0037447BB6